MNENDIVIVGASRTPFGKFGGAYLHTSAVELGALAIANTLSSIRLAPEHVTHVWMGTMYTGGLGQAPARQAAYRAGIPKEAIVVGIDKACCSSTEALVQGMRALRAGEAEIVVCGGMENMSRVPFLQKNVRWGNRMGDVVFSDYLLEGLTWPETQAHMGVISERSARRWNISREEQDELACESQRRWKQAWESGFFSHELFAVTVNKGNKEEVIRCDEHPRPQTTKEALAALKPSFTPDGEVTAGNSSGICDGAAAIVIMTRKTAGEYGLKPLATIRGYAQVGGSPEDMPSTPAWAISRLLAAHRMQIGDIDLFEINEAFAAVTLVSMKELGIEYDKTNVNGGAISIGHPVSVSGARLVMTLMYELRRSGLNLGIAALCAAGAQGDAILIEIEE